MRIFYLWLSDELSIVLATLVDFEPSEPYTRGCVSSAQHPVYAQTITDQNLIEAIWAG
jgi:hypothetical protein